MSLFKSKKEKKDNTGMENAAARIVEEPQNDENEQRDESVSRAIMMDRGIFVLVQWNGQQDTVK